MTFFSEAIFCETLNNFVIEFFYFVFYLTSEGSLFYFYKKIYVLTNINEGGS